MPRKLLSQRIITISKIPTMDNKKLKEVEKELASIKKLLNLQRDHDMKTVKIPSSNADEISKK